MAERHTTTDPEEAFAADLARILPLVIELAKEASAMDADTDAVRMAEVCLGPPPTFLLETLLRLARVQVWTIAENHKKALGVLARGASAMAIAPEPPGETPEDAAGGALVFGLATEAPTPTPAQLRTVAYMAEGGPSFGTPASHPAEVEALDAFRAWTGTEDRDDLEAGDTEAAAAVKAFDDHHGWSSGAALADYAEVGWVVVEGRRWSRDRGLVDEATAAGHDPGAASITATREANRLADAIIDRREG